MKTSLYDSLEEIKDGSEKLRFFIDLDLLK
jgi:hypothetical protein